MLILASKSPTRKTLLHNAGLSFSVIPAPIDERAIEAAAGGDKRAIAVQLACAKALAVSTTHPDDLVIGADQTLNCDDLEVHKPKDRAQAAQQLRALSGRSHWLHSGVALARGGAIVWHHVDSVEMILRDVSDAELEHVLDLEGDAILGSVGGYRLEGPSVRLFSGVKGDYFTVLGLPLLALLQALDIHAPETLASRKEQSI